MTLSSEIAFTAPVKLEPKEGPSPLAPASGHDEPEIPAAVNGEKSKQQIRTRSHTNVARRVPERFRDVKAEEKLNQKLPKGLQKQQSSDSQNSQKVRGRPPRLGKRTTGGLPL